MGLHGRPLTITLLAVLCLVVFSSCANVVRANVPSVIQVENVSYGSTIALKVHISHANPTPTHYVDKLNVMGTAGGYSRNLTFNLSPQTADPFTFEVSADLTGAPISLDQVKIQVRAHCTIHGWSAWSQEIAVPEINLTPTVLIVVLTSTLLAATLPLIRKHRYQ
jgi:desulfoferrodoxin (superoxide reductase-like protein)